jgi:hypothetical protein
MCIGSPAPPAPPPPPPAPPPPPTPVDPAVVKSRQTNRRRAALAGNRQSTIVTSSQGLEGNAPGVFKTLLGT